MIGPRLGLWIIAAIGLIMCAALGMAVSSDAVSTLIIVGAISLGVLWATAARQRWWLLVPIAGVLGGYFYFGFKLYPHEVALAASLLPLALGVAIHSHGGAGKRVSSFPTTLYLLGLYLFLHWLGSNIYNRIYGGGGYGNVTRAYFNAYWVIIFLWAFWRHGSTRYIPTALFLCYVTAGARLAIGLVTYFTNAFAYIPVINYVLPGSTHDRGADLRFSGLSLATIAACYFLIHRGFFRKSFHFLIFLWASIGLLFGSGRTVLVLVCLIPLFAAILYRKVIPLVFATFAVSVILATLNLEPTLLDDLAPRVQRSLSILLIDQTQADKYGKAGSSDEWHANMRALGYKKWTSSWNTFLFGTGIRPYDNAISETILGETTNEDYQESSAKVGAYESGWWTVTAVTGLVGLLLYLNVLFYLLRQLLPVLLRDKVSDHAHAFAFIGVFGVVIWLGLGWTNGGFPSTEIMFGFLALLALEDQNKERRPLPEVVQSAPLVRPPRMKVVAPAR